MNYPWRDEVQEIAVEQVHERVIGSRGEQRRTAAEHLEMGELVRVGSYRIHDAANGAWRGYMENT